MKHFLYSLLPTLFFFESAAQKGAATADFEGSVTYKVEVRSNLPEVSDKAMRVLLAIGNNLTIYIKKGNYRQVTDANDLHYVNADQKAYYKLKKSDARMWKG